jgi:hypothetical protein
MDTERKEPDPEMMQFIEEHQEILKGDDEVMLVRGLRKWRRVWGYCGSQKRVTAARRRMTCHARVAWCRERVIRND